MNPAVAYDIVKANRPFLSILIFLFSTDLVILSNIPLLRLVLGFAFFTIIPGLLILLILKLNKLDLAETIILSVGLSISFLMFAGLLINFLYPLFGYDTPLSINSLVLSFSVIILLLTFIASLRYQTSPFAELSNSKLDIREKAFLIIPAFFLPFSILGMHLMNTTGNNVMLMALLFLIPLYVVFVALEHNQIPVRDYPLIIFMSSISLVLLKGLRSNHIIGIDTHSEFYLFQQTFYNEHWQILLKNTLDSCLSVSILPTVYQSFLNIDPEYLFKILYPLIFSISPLIVYIISKKYISNFYAFLASFFFMSQTIFLWTAANPRTTVAILFFSLSIMVLFLRGLDESVKRSLFIIFTISCIVSHYSTTYIFFLILSITWLAMQILHRVRSSQMRATLFNDSLSYSSKSHLADLKDARPLLKHSMTSGIVILFFVVLFLWYNQITEAAFDSGVYFIAATMRSLQDFFILESRSANVADAFGYELGVKSYPQKITFVLSWLTIAFTAIGVLTTLARHRYRITFTGGGEEHTSSIISQKFDAEFFVLALICSAVLVIAVALPFVSKGYGMDRTYLQMMVVLSPFFVIGGINVARFFHIRQRYLVVLAVLIPYIICSTGMMYQVFGNFQEITLNSEGMSYDTVFVHDQESCSAKWIKYYVNSEAKMYVDYFGGLWLSSQGMIPFSIYDPSFIEDKTAIGDGYIFLRYVNVVNKKLLQSGPKWNNLTDYEHLFVDRSKIYDNCGSQVWK